MSDEAIKTVAGEITKIAVEHGYNGAAPKTITGAIDALADTLAGSDVDSGQTVAQAVRALAPYIGSGGGSLGALQFWPLLNSEITESAEVVFPFFPEVLKAAKVGSADAVADFHSVSYDDTGDVSPLDVMPRVAAGLTVTVESEKIKGVTTAYAVSGTWNKDQHDGWMLNVTAVRQLDLQFTSTDMVLPDDPEEDPVPGTITYTVPELGENEYLVFNCTKPSHVEPRMTLPLACAHRRGRMASPPARKRGEYRGLAQW